ncbi:YeaH/YhbH family protein [Siccirubricoccus phaeus]|uniref:YeaH/YhbH family protein n=1 Tax=Siccirubricoccus phaeus TaxID=2595053 RepID=UPI0011F20628|nr:YeaH/YhbH family protein [Siccirubricoccus phaeus]
MQILDRRLNPSGRSLPNRQRFLRRAKSLVQEAVRDASAKRGIRSADEGGEVSIPLHGIREPSFHHGSGGIRDHVLPGNKEYREGDEIPRPPSGGGGGGGPEGSPDGSGEDTFRFALSREEFLSLFLDDLELPDMAKRRLVDGSDPAWQRAGYSVSGSPANLALGRTMRNSMSRRIALKRPKHETVQALEEEIAALEGDPEQAERVLALRAELERQIQRTRRIPWIDPIDVRYRRFDPVPKPVARAVMFCLMDVSGSMTEDMKDLAKRFYTLLFLFLQRRYKHVEIVFIRHTHEASEVDEETFFYSRETGGTLVSTALEEMQKVVADRYPPSEWNIYAAQASDGDNAAGDSQKTARLLVDAILPACQYYAYIEVGREGEHGIPGFPRGPTDLWRTYEALVAAGAPLAMKKVRHRRDIFPVFRELFAKRGVLDSTPAQA